MSCSNNIISAFVSSCRRYHIHIITPVSHPPLYNHTALTVFVSSCRRYPHLLNYIVSASSTAVSYYIGPTHRRLVSYRSYPPPFGIISASYPLPFCIISAPFPPPFSIMSASYTALPYHISPTHRHSVSYRPPLTPPLNAKGLRRAWIRPTHQS